ncbi:MAG: hypothetical protein HY692_00050 [Cyanobacteria bacterium NC_groundwater_1444_Ag_S-0.65um_54_12]|nr:hypothetical protein [Cyanobacteria bacterium NC_groundwater_1444_Ag_S-0.65um_54_12]
MVEKSDQKPPVNHGRKPVLKKPSLVTNDGQVESDLAGKGKEERLITFTDLSRFSAKSRGSEKTLEDTALAAKKAEIARLYQQIEQLRMMLEQLKKDGQFPQK